MLRCGGSAGSGSGIFGGGGVHWCLWWPMVAAVAVVRRAVAIMGILLLVAVPVRVSVRRMAVWNGARRRDGVRNGSAMGLNSRNICCRERVKGWGF